MTKREIRVCKTHGETEFRVESVKSGKFRCGKCLSEAVKRRRAKIKILSIEYLGGKCQTCGYDKCVSALEFHHIDGSEKDFGISENGLTRSFEKVKTELDKCVLLCSNCHREEHERLRNLTDT